MRKRNVIGLLLALVLVILFFSFSQGKQNLFPHNKKVYFDETKVLNLVTLCKVWGFLKYYHPIIIQGVVNWDNELLNLMPLVYDSKNKLLRNQMLLDWIQKFGRIDSVKSCKIDSVNVLFYPDLDWIKDTAELGNNLSIILKQIEFAEKRSENYYVNLEREIRNPSFPNEDSSEKSLLPDAKHRLLALFRYWNVIEYFYPYRGLIQEDWNNVLSEFIPILVNVRSEKEYKVAILKLITHIHDTHAIAWDSNGTIKSLFGKYFAPVEISYVEKQMVVTNYLDSILGNTSQLKNGDVILTVNNKKVNTLVKKRLPIASASNFCGQMREIAFNLLRTNDSSINIKVERDDKIFSFKVKCYPSNQLQRFNKNFSNVENCCQIIDSNIAYLNLRIINNKYLNEVMPSFKKTKAMIIDLRGPPLEFLLFNLSQYLFCEPKYFAKILTGSITEPGLFTFTRSVQSWSHTNECYQGRIVVLVNEKTLSSAEYHVMAFRAFYNVIVIGSNTAGADGNISELFLPGGIYTTFSGIGIYYPDGRQTQQIGIIPDIEISPTIKGIRENKDEVLEKAIEILK